MLYDEIKRLMLEEIPVVSQVVLVGTIRSGKNVRSIVSKVLIQICAKIGGIPWKIDSMPLLDKPAMVCGLDVYHAAHLGRKSVVGFCSSFNNSATKYWSKSIVQEKGVEVCVQVQSMLENSLSRFQKTAGVYPHRLIFYRDGLGEKQLHSVAQLEIDQIKAALSTLGLEGKLQFVYIVVCKRINTRLFAQGELKDTFKNPIPGMVVNSHITDPSIREFYLVSNYQRQGMVKPTRYMIFHDSLGTPQDQLELLTYKLCHSYFNVAGAISVPAPVMYAHKLATLVGNRAGGTEPVYARDGSLITSGTSNGLPPDVLPEFDKMQGLYFL